jgi:hypothetical protein
MSSLKQIEANRHNARRSTGPTTPEGKQRSRCNALRHGLTAETVISALEDAEDYQAFEASVIADYDAELTVERELVLRLASVLWRLRRANCIESAIFESATAEPGNLEHHYSHRMPVGVADLSKRDQLCLEELRQTKTDQKDELNLDRKQNIGSAFLRLAALPTYPQDRLSRYEYMLWRQACQIVFLLETLRRRRREPRRSAFPFTFRPSER